MKLGHLNLPLNVETLGFSLITFFQVSKNQVIDVETLRIWREDRLDRDDVFHPEFLRNVIFGGVESLMSWGTKSVGYDDSINITNGPYLANLGIIHSVWRIYEDHQFAFSEFTATNAPGNGYRGHGIAVPARSYGAQQAASIESSSYSHLRGMRFTVKDNFHVRGIKTTLGNRAFFETYSTQRSNAAVVTKLLEAGAYLVGKTHLSSFAMMEYPTQSVDYQVPFNPRGDGYLIPGGSSSGSAASMASYDWLDIAICSDTTGSSRIPAFQMGLFGFPPSTNSIPDDGLVKAWPGFDTPAWIGRDLGIFPHVFGALADGALDNLSNRTSPIQSILYPTDFIPPEAKAQSMGVKTEKISIHDDWSKSSPVAEKDLHKYLFKRLYLTHDGWFYSANYSFKSFSEEYKKKNGKPPFVTEVVRWYWKLGGEVSDHEHQELMHRLSIFKDWFIKQYLMNRTSLVALHIDKAQAKYRDIYPGDADPNVPGLRSTYLSVILGAPELAIPITQLPYSSRISNKEEQLPMVVSLMGSPEADLQLLDWTLEALEKSGRSTKVKTGKVAF
ncbi:amidase signature domain-containing protein [Xylaria arbuscula]|nr:amidase signature domain-containing protein [Xylaria arbuscula]